MLLCIMVSHAVRFCQSSTQLSCRNYLTIAANLIFPADADDPFAISPEEFERDLGVNVTGGYAALHHATRGFRQLREAGSNIPMTFIATGNVTPFQPTPFAMTLSSGKAALANLIDVASVAYKATDYGYV
jgi:NAD(P)-dependent dehydrogenase (short-subunit alcohol dehydrogenase family)